MDVSVWLWGTKVGTLRYNDDLGVSSFQYDKKFIESKIQLSPIIMPLSDKTYQFDNRITSNFGLPPLLRDSLPDVYGNKMINVYLKSINREENSLNPAERLSYEGKRGMGALEYIPDISQTKDNKAINIEKLINLADRVLNEKEEFVTEDIVDLINVSTSAGGARAKAIVQYNFVTKEFRSGQIDAKDGFDFYIIKFDNFKEDKNYTRIEYMYYLMARDCGIDISDSYLLNIGGKYHFLTKRFDRRVVDNKTFKIHVQTLASLCNLDYDVPCQIGYEYMFDVLKKLNIFNKNEQLFRRMTFNVIFRNQDDHSKNTSFKMEKDGTWDLCNAYDITFACDQNNKYLKSHQTSINGKNKDINIDDLFAVARKANIGESQATQIIKEMQNVALRIDDYALKSFLSSEDIEKIKKSFIFLLADR